MLPLGPTHESLSPYQCVSSFAGNPALICLDTLDDEPWLDGKLSSHLQSSNEDMDYAELILLAGSVFFDTVSIDSTFGAIRKEYEQFLKTQSWWLEDYAWFQVLRRKFDCRSWSDWPEKFRKHDSAYLMSLRAEYVSELNYFYFQQYIFFRQWRELKDTAHKKNILLFGDIPIFVAYESADVWANQEYFKLDSRGKMLTVAGVPPDYFSATGQHWGNPHYDWIKMQKDNFAWWKQRMKVTLELFDLVRIDHFRGLDAYWEIPADSLDARTGVWVPAPGDALLNSFMDFFHHIPIVAENLGLITPSVECLRKKFRLPGMSVLQFAFDNNPSNPHLPHNHEELSVAYTGTHDNDTTMGWYQTLNETDKAEIAEYCFHSKDSIAMLMNKMCLSSVAKFAVIPMQDLLQLDSSHRMNTPGTAQGNWAWRFAWSQVPCELPKKLQKLIKVYGRSMEMTVTKVC